MSLFTKFYPSSSDVADPSSDDALATQRVIAQSIDHTRSTYDKLLGLAETLNSEQGGDGEDVEAADDGEPNAGGEVNEAANDDEVHQAHDGEAQQADEGEVEAHHADGDEYGAEDNAEAEPTTTPEVAASLEAVVSPEVAAE